MLNVLRHRTKECYARLYTKYLSEILFVHINKTAGSSIEEALGLPFQHLTAREMKELVGRERWERRFSFAFVRNPWDKVASHYHFRVKTDQTGLGDDPIAFNEWVIRAYGNREPRYYDQPKMFMPQVEWISDARGRCMIDFVGRFEKLERDFNRVCELTGSAAALPHLKSSSRPHYRELYDGDAAEVVRRRFRPDLERFGYEY